MGFDEVIRIWRRRAALTAGLVVLALASFAAELAWFPATYQSQASVVLLPSRSASRLTGGNPYLAFTPSLSLTADVVSRALMGPATARQLASWGFTDPYTVAQPTYSTTTTGSVLMITVTGTDPDGVERTIHGVISQVSLALTQIQGQVRRRSRITVTTLASSPEASLDASATVRPMVMTLVLALIAAFGLPVIIDGMLSRRKVKHAASRSSSGGLGRLRPFAGSWSRIDSR